MIGLSTLETTCAVKTSPFKSRRFHGRTEEVFERDIFHESITSANSTS